MESSACRQSQDAAGPPEGFPVFQSNNSYYTMAYPILQGEADFPTNERKKRQRGISVENAGLKADFCHKMKKIVEDSYKRLSKMNF